MRYKLIAWILMPLMVLSVVGLICPIAQAEPTTVKNVLMFYMCGDNEFSPGIIEALDKMRAAGGSDNDVTIIAMIDTKEGTTDNGIPYDDGIYYIGASPSKDYKLWTPVQELVINDPNTLAFFIDFVKTNYPADRYMLTMWDHGSGLNILKDEDSENKQVMEINDLATTLDNSGVHFDLIQFEACLMDMVEVGYALRNSANVMVASEESDYMSRPYTDIIRWLKANPDASAAEMGRQIVNGYFDIASPDRGTLAVIDLTKMPAVANSMDNLGNVLNANMPTQQSAILEAIKSSQRYEIRNFVDIIDFTNQLDSRIRDPQLQAATEAVRTSVSQAVIYKRHKGTDLQNSNGLSVNIYDGVTYLEGYSNFQFTNDTSWDEFVMELTQSPTIFSALTVDPENPWIGTPFHLQGTLTAPDPKGLKVYLQILVGSSWIDIKSTMIEDGSFVFSGRHTAAGTYNYRVHYLGSNIENGFLHSDSHPVDVNVASLAITYPNGGEKFGTGIRGGFDWISTNVDEDLKVTLNKDKRTVKTWTVTQPSGEETFKVLGEWGTGDDYTICIQGTDHPEYLDCSDGTFSIANPITVISPNGGEYWSPDTPHIIKWSAEVCPDSPIPILNCLPKDSKVQVQIIQGSSSTVEKTFNDGGGEYDLNGQIPWTVDIPKAMDYKVKVSSVANPDVYDTSDWWFYVEDATNCFQIGDRRICGGTSSIDLSALTRGSGCPPICPTVDIVKIHYYATGAVIIPLTMIDGDAAFPSINKEGLTTITYYTEDSHGNMGTLQTIEILIDQTPPIIIGSASPAGNGNGWNKQDVTVTFTCTDSMSGIMECSPPTTLSTEGSSLSVTGEAKDNAGNTATTTVGGINIDTTPPTLQLPSQVSATSVGVTGGSVTYDYSATDALSGIASSMCIPKSGTVFPLGKTTVTCSARDKADNSITGSFDVSVAYSWSGFLSPITANGKSVFNKGSTIPVKFQLTEGSAMVTNAIAIPYYAPVINDVIESYKPAASTGSTDSLFRYDPTSKQYIFNWQTKGLTAGIYQLKIDLGDGVGRTVRISLK
jgi:hypothetical protein